MRQEGHPACKRLLQLMNLSCTKMEEDCSVVSGQGVRPADKNIHIRIATVNVGTMSKRSNEIVEMLTRRRVDICCLQETRWRGGSARKIEGKDSYYKSF